MKDALKPSTGDKKGQSEPAKLAGSEWQTFPKPFKFSLEVTN